MTNRQLRTTLSFLAFLMGALGMALIGSGIFNNNDEGQSGKIAGIQEVRLVNNSPLNLDVPGNSSFDQDTKWGESVNTWKLSNSSTPYFSFQENGDLIISKLDKDLNFVRLFTLDDNPELLEVYSDSEIVYLVKNRFTKTQILVLESRNNIDSFILPIGEDITSMLYDPSQSVFYFSAKSEAGELVIYSMLNNAQMVELKRTSSVSIFAKIIGIEDEQIYLKTGTQCYKFNLYTRDATKVNCTTVYKDLEEDFIVADATSKFLNKDEDNFLINKSNLIQQIDYQIYNNSLYFIEYSKDTIEDKSLASIDISSKQYTKNKDILPDIYIADSFLAYDKFFITDGNLVYFSPLDSNSTRPVSYPDSFSEISLPVGWSKLSIQNSVSDLKLLNHRITEI